jgi:hypothetical protein
MADPVALPQCPNRLSPPCERVFRPYHPDYGWQVQLPNQVLANKDWPKLGPPYCGVFNPTEPLDSGDAVLLQDRSGGHHIRYFRPLADGTWEGYSELPGCRTMRSDEGLLILGVMTHISGDLTT